jgi:hypothetical protein
MIMSTDNDTPEREKQVVELLRAAAASERAPDWLHARVATMRDEAAAAPRRRLLPRPAFNIARFALPTAAGVAALVIALGGGAGAPSIAQAAALGTRGPTAPAPAPDPSAPAKLLSAKVGNLHFPNWQADGGWRSVGQRHDQAGNRAVTTVYYSAGRTEIAYSIVAQPKLPGLKHAEPYETIWRHGRVTVAWEEDGHTCLLSGTGISPARLWQLASIR